MNCFRLKLILLSTCALAACYAPQLSTKESESTADSPSTEATTPMADATPVEPVSPEEGSASTKSAQAVSPAAVGCKFATCNDKDPKAMGCTNDAKVIWTTEIKDLMRIKGMASSACGSQWTWVKNLSFSVAQPLHAYQWNGKNRLGWTVANVPFDWEMTSLMVDAPPNFARACGDWEVDTIKCTQFGY